MELIHAIAALAALWNLVALFVTLHDKSTARRNGTLEPNKRRRRVPEKRFLMFAATFAGAGVLVGFYGARHKTKHIGLLVGVWALTALSYGAAAAIYFLLK